MKKRTSLLSILTIILVLLTIIAAGLFLYVHGYIAELGNSFQNIIEEKSHTAITVEENDKNDNKSEEPTMTTEELVTEATKPEIVELVLRETYTFPIFDITITGFDFSDAATNPGGSGVSILPEKDYVVANLYYDIKYTGKASCDSSYFSPFNIDYNDGYSFLIDRFYYYDTGVDAWLNSGTIDPLTPEFSCKACFYVPMEVQNNEEAPLFVKFTIGSDDVIYKVR